MNKKNSLVVTGSLLVCLALVGCASSQTAKLADEKDFSGYLSNYADLREVKAANGVDYLGWRSDASRSGVYKMILPSKVVFYPAIAPDQQASRETLVQIRDYFYDSLRRALANEGVLANAPGPGTVQLDMAITGVLIQTEGMKAYEVIPIAAVIGATTAAAGYRDKIVQLIIEGKMTDSVSGAMVASAVYKGLGKDLKDDKQQLTLEDVKPALDAWAQTVATRSASVIKAGS